MLRALILLAFIITVTAVPTMAVASVIQELGWIDQGGNPVPDSNSQKSVRGFGGMLVVTPDVDWEEKWSTPSGHTPHFTAANQVKVGQELTILPLFTNPKVGDDGFVRIKCDLRVIRPDQSLSIDEKDLDCFTYDFTGTKPNLRNIWLSGVIPKYIGESTDLKGEWIVELVFKDVVRNVLVPLKTTFTLIDG